jgi:hypothetical protein
MEGGEQEENQQEENKELAVHMYGSPETVADNINNISDI